MPNTFDNKHDAARDKARAIADPSSRQGPPIERERRYLVERLPAPLPKPLRLVQGYLTTDPVTLRVRSIDDSRFVLAVKAGTGRTRTEVERAITAEEFEALWPHSRELRIEKRRHLIELGDGNVAELDLFDGALAGRRLVEVEFDSAADSDAFRPPSWFGREVTDDRRYTNRALAANGWPAERDDAS